MSGLQRSKKNRMLAGVAGGLAEYFGVDVALVRLLWVLTFFVGGTGVLVYIIASIVIPEEKNNSGPVLEAPGTEQEAGSETDAHETREDLEKKAAKARAARETRRRNAGLLLIGLGIVFLVEEVFPWDLFQLSWPLLLIVVGILIMARGRKEPHE